MSITESQSRIYIKERSLDLISIMTLMMFGFISHPNFNDLVRENNPQEYIELVRDEFRQLNGYIDATCKASHILKSPAKYTDPDVQKMVIEFGHNYATRVILTSHFLSYQEAIAMFHSLMKKHYNKG